MRVLVTGASGRIGAHIVQELTRQGHTVRAAVRPASSRAAKLAPFDAEVVEADLLDTAAPARCVDNMEAIVHNGVIFTQDPVEMISGSLDASAALLDVARRAGCSRFVFISSTSVYEGTAFRPGDPIREEEAAPEITNVYGACKLGVEALCSAYEREHGLPCVSLRFPMVTAGAELLRGRFLLETWRERRNPGDMRERSEGSWRGAVEAAWDGGARLAVPLNLDGSPWKRHYCDVRDAARSVLLALEAPEAPGRAYNIASVPIRYDRAADTLADLSGWTSAHIEVPDQYRYEFSLARAKEFLEYEPAFDTVTMIRDAWSQRAGAAVPGLIAP